MGGLGRAEEGGAHADHQRGRAHTGETYPGTGVVAFTVSLPGVGGTVRPRAPIEGGTVELGNQVGPEVVRSASRACRRQRLKTRLGGQDLDEGSRWVGVDDESDRVAPSGAHSDDGSPRRRRHFQVQPVAGQVDGVRLRTGRFALVREVTGALVGEKPGVARHRHEGEVAVVGHPYARLVRSADPGQRVGAVVVEQ